MYDNKERIRRTEILARQMRRRRKNQLLASLSALSIILFLSLVGLISSLTGSIQLQKVEMYGSILLRENVDSYILVAVLAFIVATLLTLLGIRREIIKDYFKRKE